MTRYIGKIRSTHERWNFIRLAIVGGLRWSWFAKGTRAGRVPRLTSSCGRAQAHTVREGENVVPKRTVTKASCGYQIPKLKAQQNVDEVLHLPLASLTSVIQAPVQFNEVLQDLFRLDSAKFETRASRVDDLRVFSHVP